MALLVRGIRTLNRRLRSLSSNSYEMTTYEEMGISSESGYATRFIQHLVRCEKHTGIIYKCLDIISYHTVFNSCSHDTKLKVLSTVFDQIRNYPQADPVEVFLMKIYLRSMCTDDGKNVITRNEVMSRVFDVIESYPKVGCRKVSEATCYCMDLEFDDLDADVVEKALYLEFRLAVPIPTYVSQVKNTIDDIYKNIESREDLASFREDTRLGNLFWPVHLA